jgi:hypothetical protein
MTTGSRAQRRLDVRVVLTVVTNFFDHVVQTEPDLPPAPALQRRAAQRTELP